MSTRMLVTECFDGNHAACKGYNGPSDNPNFTCDCDCHSTTNAASAHNSDSVRLTSQEEKTMTNEEFEAAEDLVDRWLRGYLEGQSATNKKLISLIKQLCRDLNEAHNEILRQQGVAESDYGKYDWPEWTPQANSIRWAERETKERLAKTDHWTLYSAVATPASHEEKSDD